MSPFQIPRPSRPSLLLGACAAALLLSLAPSIALADDGAARAQRAFKGADYETALREYRALVKDKPAPELLLQIARSLDRLLRSNDAIVAYQHVLHSGASTAQAKESRDRIAFLREFLARGATPDKLAANHIERGTALYKLELYREARAEFEGAVQLLPEKPNGYRWLGLTLERLGDCKAAIGDFETFLSIVPSDDPRTEEINAGVKRCNARSAGAEATAGARPVGDEPLGPKASEREKKVKEHVDHGADLYAAGRFKEAREEFAIARTLAPEKVTPFRWLGLCDAQLERCGDAVQNLEVFLGRVPATDPRVPEVKEVIAACRDRMAPASKRPSETPAAAGGTTRPSEPSSPGESSRAGGKVPSDAPDGKSAAEAKAAAATTAAASKDPEVRARALIEKGAGLFHKGNVREARDAFEAARALLPERANAYRWLGLADAKLGHCREAIASFDVFIQRVSADDDRITEVARVRGRCARELTGPSPAVAAATPAPRATAPSEPRPADADSARTPRPRRAPDGEPDSDAPRTTPSSRSTTPAPASERPAPRAELAPAPASKPAPAPTPAPAPVAAAPSSPARDTTPAPAPAPRSSGSSLPSYTAPLAVGVGAVALVAVGGGVVGWAQSQYDSLAATCKPNCSQADADSVRDKRYAGYSIMAVGGVAAVGDAVLWYFWAKNRGRDKPAALVLPALNGVVVTGRF